MVRGAPVTAGYLNMAITTFSLRLQGGHETSGPPQESGRSVSVSGGWRLPEMRVRDGRLGQARQPSVTQTDIPALRKVA
jgi:hypothetical protein